MCSSDDQLFCRTKADFFLPHDGSDLFCEPGGDLPGLGCPTLAAEDLTALLVQKPGTWPLFSGFRRRFEIRVIRIRNDLDVHLDATTYLREFRCECCTVGSDVTDE